MAKGKAMHKSKYLTPERQTHWDAYNKCIPEKILIKILLLVQFTKRN